MSLEHLYRVVLPLIQPHEDKMQPSQ